MTRSVGAVPISLKHLLVITTTYWFFRNLVPRYQFREAAMVLRPIIIDVKFVFQKRSVNYTSVTFAHSEV